MHHTLIPNKFSVFYVVLLFIKGLRISLSSGMNHESNKSTSLGMISTATRTTATVSPLSPLTNGNTVSQSTNSGFAAALRKLAKQAEDPRGEMANFNTLLTEFLLMTCFSHNTAGIQLWSQKPVKRWRHSIPLHPSFLQNVPPLKSVLKLCATLF